MLAAAAFEAYLEPTTATGLTDVAINGTETHYVDRDFVQDIFVGVLKVTARSARNLRAADVRSSLQMLYSNSPPPKKQNG